MTSQINNYEVKWSLRQNMGRIATRVFNTVLITNVIVCAGYYSRDRCPYDENGAIILQEGNRSGNRYINDISVGDYAIIFETGNTRSVLLVLITSNAYRKIIPEISIYKRDGENVEICLTGHQTRQFNSSEIMEAYVRDIEVICELEYNEYYAIIEKYKSIQSSIARNWKEERFISHKVTVF
jgi:hypothetical protein